MTEEQFQKRIEVLKQKIKEAKDHESSIRKDRMFYGESYDIAYQGATYKTAGLQVALQVMTTEVPDGE